MQGNITSKGGITMVGTTGSGCGTRSPNKHHGAGDHVHLPYPRPWVLIECQKSVTYNLNGSLQSLSKHGQLTCTITHASSIIDTKSTDHYFQICPSRNHSNHIRRDCLISETEM